MLALNFRLNCYSQFGIKVKALCSFGIKGMTKGNEMIQDRHDPKTVLGDASTVCALFVHPEIRSIMRSPRV